jgi:hypothetical protein
MWRELQQCDTLPGPRRESVPSLPEGRVTGPEVLMQGFG